MTTRIYEGGAKIDDRFVSAAEANEYVQMFRAHPVWSTFWTPDRTEKNPPVRVEYEHVIVLGTPDEARTLQRNKSGWGKLLSIKPLLPDDELNPFRIVYIYKESSTQHQSYMRRVRLKAALGKHGKLVTLAVKFSKGIFLKKITSEDEQVIHSKLGTSAADFWRVCRGRDTGQKSFW